MSYEQLEIASSGLYSSSSFTVGLAFDSFSFMLAKIFVRLGGIDMLASTFDEDEGLSKICKINRVVLV